MLMENLRYVIKHRIFMKNKSSIMDELEIFVKYYPPCCDSEIIETLKFIHDSHSISPMTMSSVVNVEMEFDSYKNAVLYYFLLDRYFVDIIKVSDHKKIWFSTTRI